MALVNIEYFFLPSPSGIINVILKNKLNKLFKVIFFITGINEKVPANQITKLFIKRGKIKLESFGTKKNLNKKNLREIKKYEINRIFIFRTEDGRTNRCIKKVLK